MFRNSVVLSSIVSLLASQVALAAKANPVTKQADGDYSLAVCELQAAPQSDVSWTWDGGRRTGKVRNTKCAGLTLKAADVAPGTEVTLTTSSSYDTTTVKIPGTASGGAYSGSQTQQQPTQQSQQQTAAQREAARQAAAAAAAAEAAKQAELAETAEIQARFVANRVVTVFRGAQEVLHRYQNGLHAGIWKYEGDSNELRRLIDEISATSDGASIGRAEGRSTGETAGKSAGNREGAADIRQAFINGADRGRLELDQSPTCTYSDAIQLPRNTYLVYTALTSSARLNAYNTTLYSDLNSYNIVWQADDYAGGSFFDRYQNRLTVSNLYSGGTGYTFNDFVSSYRDRDDNAWQAWVEGESWIGTREPYSRGRRNFYREAYQYYQALSYGDQQAFAAKFKAVYNQVIAPKWNNPREIFERNPQVTQAFTNARAKGQTLGFKIARAYATDKARAEGYQAAYPQALKDGYYNSCLESYRTAFNTGARRYETSVVVTSATVSSAPSTGGAAYLPWSTLHVSASSVKNAGRQAGTVSVAVKPVTRTVWNGRQEATASVLKAGPAQSLALPKAATAPGSQTFYNLGQLTEDTPPNTEVPVVLDFAGNSDGAIETKVTIKLSDVVQALAKTQDQSQRAIYWRYAHRYLSEEWASDEWKDALAYEVRTAYQTCTPQCQGELKRTFGKSFKDIYGPQPRGGQRKQRWDKIMFEILNVL
jgi:hypothetical protein